MVQNCLTGLQFSLLAFDIQSCSCLYGQFYLCSNSMQCKTEKHGSTLPECGHQPNLGDLVQDQIT